MELRPYQTEAVQAVYDHLCVRDDNPCVVIPTGGGKTPVIATICRDAVELWEGRVVILAHVKELREQVEENCDYVGEKFPEEARKMHYGETGTRNIYGEASESEADELREEGIEFQRIPWTPSSDA